MDVIAPLLLPFCVKEGYVRIRDVVYCICYCGCYCEFIVDVIAPVLLPFCVKEGFL